jgi:hypothetical protein
MLRFAKIIFRTRNKNVKLWQRCTVAQSLNWLPTSVEQNSPWEAESRSTGQDDPRLLYNLKVECRVNKSSPLVRIATYWASWVQSTRLHPISLIPIFTLSSHQLLGLAGLSRKVLHAYLISSCMLHVRYHSWLEHPDSMWWRGTNYEAPPVLWSILCYFIPSTSRYSPCHFVFRHP